MSDEIKMMSPLPGVAEIPGMGSSFLPEYYNAEVDISSPELEPIPLKHPWMATRTAPNKFTVAVGKVYGVASSVQEAAAELTVDTNVDAWKVWAKITHASLVITAVELGQGTTIPADTATIMYRQVVEFYRIPGVGDPYLAIIQIENSHLRIITGSTGASGEDHPWKATAGVVTPAEGEGLNPTQNLEIAGGTIYTQTGFAGVFVAADTIADVETGTVFLKIGRDASTRALDSWAIEFHAEDDPQTDTAYYQFIPLAQITVSSGSITGILQLKFEDLCLFEDMAAINGEFKFVPLAMHGRNPYDLPAA